MNNTEYGIATALLVFLTSVLTLMVNKKLTDAKAGRTNVESMKEVIDKWKELIGEKEKQNGLLHQAIERKDTKIDSLEQCKAWLESELKTVIEENRRLREELEEYRNNDTA